MIKWKKVNRGAISPSLIIMIPSCLRVDRAIIFFISFSTRAANPAIVVVRVARIRSRVSLWVFCFKRGKNRRSR